MGAAQRVPAVVTTPTPSSQEAFATAVLAVVQEHGVASEQCWQALSRLIAVHWQELAADQSAVHTWKMLARCPTTILRLRRTAKRGKGTGGETALAEFRQFMQDVIRKDDQTRECH